MPARGDGQSPCPYRIWEEIGQTFIMGVAGGTIYNALRGARLSPTGERFAGSVDYVKLRAPKLGGQFAMFGFYLAIFDCSITAVRGVESVQNTIAAGFCTGAALAARNGRASMMMSSFSVGIFFVCIEGITMWFNKMPMEAPPPTQPDKPLIVAEEGGEGYETETWGSMMPSMPGVAQESPNFDTTSSPFGSDRDFDNKRF